ncbi:MAG: hypothetical protein V4638_02300 [Bacteroidota bacterium]
MKKLVYISFVILAVALSSCTKETIVPMSENAAVPQWKSAKTDTTPSFDPTTTTDDEGSGITDPNNDEDGNKKRRAN